MRTVSLAVENKTDVSQRLASINSKFQHSLSLSLFRITSFYFGAMDAKQKRLRPKLDRRDANKNIDYDAPPSSISTSSSDGDHSYPPPGLRSRSLELFQFSDNQTSFRVKGGEGEFDLICRSLGLSGPEDFAIPTAAWEAHTARSSSDISSRSSPAKPQPHNELQARVGAGASNFAEPVSRRTRVSLDSATVGPSGGIKGARPPLILRTLMDNVGSTWDLVKSFAPPESDAASNEEVRGARPPLMLRPTGVLKSFAPPLSDVASNKEVSGGIVEREDSEEGVRLGVTDCRLESSSSRSSNSNDNGNRDDHNVVVIRTSSVVSVSSMSPSGKLRRSITSWQKGELLGSGSFGTVFEGFTE